MPTGCFGVGLLNSFFPLPWKYRATESHVHTLHSINAGRVKTIKPVQPNVCFCQTVWKQYLFGLYPNWLSEHGQQHFNICVTAHKPSGDSLAAPAAFSTVSVNMHNIWNTSVKTLPAWRPSSATKTPLLLIQVQMGHRYIFQGNHRTYELHSSLQQHCGPSADFIHPLQN